MRSTSRLAKVFIGVSFFSIGAHAEPPSLANILTEPIQIERGASVTEIPFGLRSGKIYLPAMINDFSGEFVFDTGSPTILDQSLADQLNLEIIGENSGRDANGNVVKMKIALVDSIVLGDTRFQDVPVMVHDYSTVPLGKCYLPNGLLGSELLPGSAWQVDVPNAKLKIASSADELSMQAPTFSAPLHIFHYPFAPIVDYSIGRFSDKALFDTGNASSVALFAEIENDKQVRKQIDRRSVKTGAGRHGTSAGGLGDTLPLKRFDLKTVKIGDYDLGRTSANSRPVPPTLIGAGILRTHVITLDYPSRRFMMTQSEGSIAPISSPGFALMVNDAQIEVSQLFETSQAKKAGLKLGDRVVAIDGQKLSISTESEKCETSLWLSNEFDPTAVEVLTVQRDDELLDIAF